MHGLLLTNHKIHMYSVTIILLDGLKYYLEIHVGFFFIQIFFKVILNYATKLSNDMT